MLVLFFLYPDDSSVDDEISHPNITYVRGCAALDRSRGDVLGCVQTNIEAPDGNIYPGTQCFCEGFLCNSGLNSRFEGRD